MNHSLITQANVSNKRIQKFLNNEEIDEYAVNKTALNSEGNRITIENGSFRWSNSIDDPLILKKFLTKIEYFLENNLFHFLQY